MSKSFRFKNNIYLDAGSIRGLMIKQVGISSVVASSQKVVITLAPIPLDCLVWITYHSGVSNNYFGGSILLNVGYGANIVSHAVHNSSGYSLQVSSNASSGIVLTIVDNNITATDTFNIQSFRTLSYNYN